VSHATSTMVLSFVLIWWYDVFHLIVFIVDSFSWLMLRFLPSLEINSAQHSTNRSVVWRDGTFTWRFNHRNTNPKTDTDTCAYHPVSCILSSFNGGVWPELRMYMGIFNHFNLPHTAPILRLCTAKYFVWFCNTTGTGENLYFLECSEGILR